MATPLQELMERYQVMLENFVQVEDAIKEHGIEAVRDSGVIPLSGDNVTDEQTLAILSAFQCALVNVLNDLDSVVAAEKESL